MVSVEDTEFRYYFTVTPASDPPLERLGRDETNQIKFNVGAIGEECLPFMEALESYR